MKGLAKLLLIGMMAMSAIFLWAWHGESETQAPVQWASVQPKTAAPSPAMPQVELPQKSTLSLDETLSLLHGKLLQWRQARANDPNDQEGQARLMQEMLVLVTDENVAELVPSLSPEEMDTPFGVGALHHWMQVDPVQVTHWLASRAETTEAQTMTVADDWMGHRAGLQHCIDQLPDTEWKQSFLSSLASEMSVNDPQSAIKVAQQMKPGQAQTWLLQEVACNWVGADPDAALAWVASVRDPSLQEQLIVSAAQSYALTDPAQAATWLVSEVKSPQVEKDAALNILKIWVVKDPAQAADWVAQFPEGSTKTAAVQIVSQHWQQTDHAAATAWIQNLSARQGMPSN